MIAMSRSSSSPCLAESPPPATGSEHDKQFGAPEEALLGLADGELDEAQIRVQTELDLVSTLEKASEKESEVFKELEERINTVLMESLLLHNPLSAFKLLLVRLVF